jgi:hypothetical protein
MAGRHTLNPSDRGFAKIEKFSKNRTQAVYDPDGWHQIVLQSNRRKPFNVTVKKSEDSVIAQIDRYNNKKSNDGNNLHFSSVCSFRFTQKEKTQC